MAEPIIHPTPVNVDTYTQVKLPCCTSAKVWLAVSSIFLAAAFGAFIFCACIHNIHALTGFGLSVAATLIFIPSIRNLSRPLSDLKAHLKPGEKIVAHGITFACLEKNENLVKYQLSKENFSYQHFQAWLLEKAPENKNKIFEQTLLPEIQKLNEKPVSITYARIKGACDLEEEKPTTPMQIECQEGWYDYKDERATYIDFANAYTFGGTWREEGHTQEEIMFEQSPKLALLAYLADQAEISPAPVRGFPFIVENVEMKHKIPDGLYGANLKNVSDNFEPEQFNDSKPVTITGIAAKAWNHQGAYYYPPDLEFHFQAFYRACQAQKILNPKNPVVHTGAWGCGTDNNSEKTMTVLQMFAAHMAGVKVVFHGVGHALKPNYSEHFIKNEATPMIEKCWTANALFDEIISKQASPEWRSKA